MKVDANAKGYKKLQVRTRSGYYAGQQRTASATALARTHRKVIATRLSLTESFGIT